MAYRNRYLTVKLPEADWEGVRDIANLQGETLSTAGWKLIQRGVEGYEKEMGSSTPLQVRIHRLNQRVKKAATEEQLLKDAYTMITQREEGIEREALLKEIHGLAEEAKVNLT